MAKEEKKEEKVEKVEKAVSEEKARRMAIVEKYKAQNPEKYAIKAAVLEKWINEA